MSDLGRALAAIAGTHLLTHGLARASNSEDHSGKSVKDRLQEIYPELKKRKDIVLKDGAPSVTFKGEKDNILRSLVDRDIVYEIRSGKKESTGALAHEVGHILNDDMWGRPGRAVNLLSRASSNMAQPINLVLSGLGPVSMGPAVLQAALAAPMLIDEALASGRAAHMLIKTKGFKEGLHESLPLIPAFGSYASHSAAPAIVTLARSIK